MNEKGRQQLEQSKVAIDWESSYARFSQLLADEPRLLELYQQSEVQAREVPDKLRKSGGAGWQIDALTTHDASPAKCDLSFLTDDLLQSQVRELLAQRPSLLLELQDWLEHQVATAQITDGKLLDDFFDRADQLTDEEFQAQRNQLEQQQRERNSQLLTTIFEKAGIAVAGLPIEQLFSLRDAFEKTAEFWRNIAYSNHLIAEAANTLKQLIPSMATEISTIVEELVLVQPKRMPTRSWPFSRTMSRFFEGTSGTAGLTVLEGERTIVGNFPTTTNPDANAPDGSATFAKNNALSKWWGSGSENGLSFIVVPPRINSESTAAYPEHVLVAMHELLHCLIDGKLLPLYGKRYSEETQRVQEGVLGRVLHEGAAIALEYLVINHVQSGQVDAARILQQFGKDRLKYIRDVNRLRNPSKLAALAEQSEVEDLELADTDVAYSEGAKLAIALARNGWQLSDLPQLLESISAVVSSATSTDPSEWSRMPVTQSHGGDQTTYEKVMASLKALKPRS